MLGIKDKSDLEKYAEESQSPLVKESVEKLNDLNSDADFVYQYSPEEDDELITNTRIYEAKKDGIEIGEARGEARGIEIGEIRGKTLAYIELGLSKEDIALKVGLSENEIEEIIRNSK